MTESLRLFMDRLIDYAGLFPPAMLDMPAATRAFSQHLDSDFSWMLGCFICPVARLDEFATERSVLERHQPVSVSVLGTKPDGDADLTARAHADAAVVVSHESSGWMRGRQLEVKWPSRLIGADELDRYAAALASAGCSFERIFIEIERSPDWERDVAAMSEALAAAEGDFGFKIRTGGVTPDLYPNSTEVAAVIEACRNSRVPFKATAGLHHPIRHDRTDPTVTEHGFFNVFFAAAVAHSLGADRQTIVALIEDREASNFRFEEDSIGWRDMTVPRSDLLESRSRLGYSFGSCSFDEPLEDLAGLNLL